MTNASALMEWWRFFSRAAPLLFITQLAAVMVGLSLMGPAGVFEVSWILVVMVCGMVLRMSGTNFVPAMLEDFPAMVGLSRLPDKEARRAQDIKVASLFLTMTLLAMFHYLENTFTSARAWFERIMIRAGSNLPDFMPVLDKDALSESRALTGLALALFMVSPASGFLSAIWTRKSVPRPVPRWKAITLAWSMWVSIVATALLMGCSWPPRIEEGKDAFDPSGLSQNRTGMTSSS